MSTEATEQTWTRIIRPQRERFDFNVRELWAYRDLVFLFVRRDFVAQYQQTILGPLWFVLQPLLTTLVFTVVFGRIAGLSTDGLPPILFYLSGVVFWGYFAACLSGIANTFSANAGLFGKVYFPRLAVPCAMIFSYLLRFLLQMLFLGAFIAFFIWCGMTPGIQPSAVWMVPLLVVIMAVMALGMGIVFSSLTTKYRDLRFLLSFGIQLAMYLSPVIISTDGLSASCRYLLLANPMSAVINTARYELLGAGSFSIGALLYSAGFAVLVFMFGLKLFATVERNVMDTV